MSRHQTLELVGLNNTAKNCKAFGVVLKVVPLYLERLPIRQIILHDLANPIREAHTEKRKRNLCMSMHQAQLKEVMSYSCWILKDERQHIRVKQISHNEVRGIETYRHLHVPPVLIRRQSNGGIKRLLQIPLISVNLQQS